MFAMAEKSGIERWLVLKLIDAYQYSEYTQMSEADAL